MGDVTEIKEYQEAGVDSKEESAAGGLVLPDVWDIIRLTNHLRMPALHFKLLVILKEACAEAGGFTTMGLDRILVFMGPWCNSGRLSKIIKDLVDRQIIYRQSRGFRKTKETAIIFTTDWTAKAWDSWPYCQKRWFDS